MVSDNQGFWRHRWSLDYIAIEIENPFGMDANDIDGCHLQEQMNRHLILLISEDASILPTLSPYQWGLHPSVPHQCLRTEPEPVAWDSSRELFTANRCEPELE